MHFFLNFLAALRWSLNLNIGELMKTFPSVCEFHETSEPKLDTNGTNRSQRSQNWTSALLFACRHYPKTSFTIVTDTPENLRLKQQTQLNSQVSSIAPLVSPWDALVLISSRCPGSCVLRDVSLNRCAYVWLFDLSPAKKSPNADGRQSSSAALWWPDAE